MMPRNQSDRKQIKLINLKWNLNILDYKHSGCEGRGG